MIRPFLDFLAKLRSDGLHPDLSLDDGTAVPNELPVNSQATPRSTQASNDLHPDFDFDEELDQLIEEAFDVSSGTSPSILQEEESLRGDLALGHDENRHDEAWKFQDQFEELFSQDYDALTPVEALDDIVLENEVQPLEDDWGDYSTEPVNGITDIDAQPHDTFDFDISDLEAGLEAEPLMPENQSVRHLRLERVAADLVMELGAFLASERRALHRRFREIVEEFPHPASHQALRRLLKAGASFEEIEEAASLRLLWLEQPSLWGQKRFVVSSWEVLRNPGQRLAFGWSTALRLVRVFGIVEAERALNEDWFRDWIEMQRHQQTSFADLTSFFTYSEFLKQLSPSFHLSSSEGVHEEPADREETMEIIDAQGFPIWRLERKLPQLDAKFP